MSRKLRIKQVHFFFCASNASNEIFKYAGLSPQNLSQRCSSGVCRGQFWGGQAAKVVGVGAQSPYVWATARTYRDATLVLCFLHSVAYTLS